MNISRKSAFTLIELLVVIAVVALLVSILMPSLARSKDLAREVSCRQNQRNIYMMIQLYANDNRQNLPYAWRTMERQWNGWNWRDANDLTYLPQKLTKYMPLLDVGWFDPGWPMDQPYEPDMKIHYVNGTPTHPSAGHVPNTPRNFGLGYNYTAYMWINYWYSVDDPDRYKREATKVNFHKVLYPQTSKVMTCLLSQQAPALGRVGPHHRGTIWNILWADGGISTTTGVFNEPQSLDVYCNSPGDWHRTPY
ncbi:MAG: prepilin-type N-terminal cleavage/methylation domain-containing protein [Phycisphaerae bacterium]|nr:prepilin-type N-terminal cleavage/methylation domain-containing protein [Phycisphaerae bacterium]